MWRVLFVPSWLLVEPLALLEKELTDYRSPDRDSPTVSFAPKPGDWATLLDRSTGGHGVAQDARFIPSGDIPRQMRGLGMWGLICVTSSSGVGSWMEDVQYSVIFGSGSSGGAGGAGPGKFLRGLN